MRDFVLQDSVYNTAGTRLPQRIVQMAVAPIYDRLLVYIFNKRGRVESTSTSARLSKYDRYKKVVPN